MLSILSRAYWPSVCLLRRNVYLSLCLFIFLFIWILSCMSCRYILVTPVANIFPLSVGYLFVLLMVSFAMQKFLSLIMSHLFIIAFISFAWEIDLRKHCYDLCQRMLCLYSLLRVLWCHVLFLGL